jgi:nicotinic acid mononucleotide adenylyltransferase
LITKEGAVQLNTVVEQGVVVSGSFNPLHEAHISIAKRTADICKIPHSKIYYELSIINADKGSICSDVIRERAEYFR